VEVVNTTTISPAECIAFLLDRGGLNRLIGANSCACFVVSRPLDAPNFYARLIKNVATIDATIRQYIAFIVFYGESTVYARASHYHEPYQFIEAKLQGFSCSMRFDERLDATYGTLFRESPEKVNYALFEQFMARSSDALMDRLGLRGRDAPCLVFVDPKDTSNRHVVHFKPKDAFTFIYSNILSPLADAFRDL